MKALVVTTIINTVEAFLIPHINLLNNEGYTVDIATNTCEKKIKELDALCDNIFNIGFSRNLLSKSNIKAYKDIKSVIKNNNYDLIYVHTPIASAITRLACRDISNTKIIYFAHGFHFFKGAPLKNRIIFYPIEKYLSKYTDILVTINNEDYIRATKKLKANKTVMTNGVGIDLDKIESIFVNKDSKRNELGLKKDDIVLLSVGELNENKNHIEVIKAIDMMKNKNNIKYLICGEGNKIDYLTSFIKDHNLENNVKLLGYRNDIIELCKISDIFVFPSKREGLPVSVMEAMACGLPVVCSNIRGSSDLIENKRGGSVVEHNYMRDYCTEITNLINNPLLIQKYGQYNRAKIKKYSLKNIIDDMRGILNYI